MARLLAVLAVAASAAAPISLAIRPGPADTLTVIATRETSGEDAGAFSGTVSLNGSPAEARVTGQAERSGSRLRLSLTLRYADIPADWADRFRLGTFDYRLRGTVGGHPADGWRGSMPWKDVQVEGEKDNASKFVRLGSLQITRFSLLESEARASVSVRNPLSFPLKLAGASYRLLANGREVGSGEAHGMLLHASQDNTLDFPIEIEHAQLLSAAGSALASGGEIEGRLRGELVVRLAGGDIAVPLDLSGRLDLLSE